MSGRERSSTKWNLSCDVGKPGSKFKAGALLYKNLLLTENMARLKHSSYRKFSRKEFIREKKHVIILACIFIAVLITCGLLIWVKNKENSEVIYYSEIEECTLPVITMQYNNTRINRLFGYIEEMDMQYIRDSIYILDSGYDLPLTVKLYGNMIKSMEFFLYDMDSNALIQHSEASRLEMSDEDEMSALLRIDNIINTDTEYFIDIMMRDVRKRDIHYYSRIMFNSTSPVKEMMDLVMEHHDAMYDRTKYSFLNDYQEPNSAVNDSTNFGNISLSSTVNSMYWGTMGVRVLTEPVVNIIDVDNDIAFFRLSYQVGRVSEEGVWEYYNVSEYYRTRMYDDRRFILSYERKSDQIFVPVSSYVGNKSVLIGISHDLEIQTMTNAKYNMNVFVVGKSVWFLDTDTKLLQKVFSFETDPLDIRQNYDQHDIKLLKITDEGDFQFLVYGYMNRGMHEGHTGIGLYTYYADKNEVREDIFIPSHLPFQVLKNSIGSLCYLNNSGILYIMLDEFVYSLNPGVNKASLIVSGLNENNYKVSADGRMLAWQDGGNENDAVRINVMDLETEKNYYVDAEEGKNIKVLGFLNRDLVYGEGDSGRTYITAEGEEYLLMQDLYVVNSNLIIQSQEHSSIGYFVTSLVEYNRVVVNRVVRVGNEYSRAEEFTLFSTNMESHPAATSYTVYDEDRRTVNYVEVVKAMESNKPAQISDTMKITLSSAEAADVGDMLSDSGKYYVYAAGEIIDILTSPSEAILRAYYSTGVVVTQNGYFYRRSSRPATVELTEGVINRAIRSYDAGDVLNITGIYLMQALYYTGRKIPVIWEWGSDTYIICGYDLFDNLMLRNIYTGEDILVTYDEVDQIFDESGRCFITEGV